LRKKEGRSYNKRMQYEKGSCNTFRLVELTAEDTFEIDFFKTGMSGVTFGH
jgi:hypothetical protein